MSIDEFTEAVEARIAARRAMDGRMCKLTASIQKRWVASLEDGFWRGILGLSDAKPGEQWLTDRGNFYEPAAPDG